MPKLSKRRRAINEQVEAGKIYSADEALNLLKVLPLLSSARLSM